MKEMVRYGFILALICIVATGLLAAVNSLTNSRIIAQEQTEEQVSLKEVMPDAKHFEGVKSGTEIVYYKAYDKKGKFIGVAFKTSGKGYSSDIDTLVGMDKGGNIISIKILNQNETPGLGSRVTDHSFTKQFANKDTRGLAEVQAITGATISSRAVIKSVEKRTEEIKPLIKDER